MDSRHFVSRHVSVSADQYNRQTLLAAECRISITESVRPLWENGLEKLCWKPDYDLQIRKINGEVAWAAIIQLKLSSNSLSIPLFQMRTIQPKIPEQKFSKIS